MPQQYAERKTYSREGTATHSGRSSEMLTLVGRDMPPVQRSRECSDIIIQSMIDGVITAGPGWAITFMNAAAESLTGFKAEEARGRPMVNVLISKNPSELDENQIYQIGDDGSICTSRSSVIISRDGRETHIEFVVSLIRDSRKVTKGYVVVLRKLGRSYSGGRSLMLDKPLNRVIPDNEQLPQSIGPVSKEKPTLPTAMTRRERETMVLIVEGLSNKEIAQKLNIAVYTVKCHVHNILQKLGLHSRLEILKHMYDYGVFRAQLNRGISDNEQLPQLIGPVSKGELTPPAAMTRRERETMVLIVEGLSNKEIAQKLNIATYTAKCHVHNILQKLGLHSRLEILKHMYDYGAFRAQCFLR